jgi:hypothetical protein
MTPLFDDSPVKLSAMIKLIPITLSSLNSGRISRLAAAVQKAPRLNGAINDGNPTLVGTEVPDYLPPKLLKYLLLGKGEKPRPIIYTWTDFPTLPIVTFTTFFHDSPPLRVVFPPGSKVITAENREFIWVFFRSSKPIGAVRVLLTDPLLDSYLQDAFRVLESPANPILSDFVAIWLVGRIGSLNKALNSRERLQLSWANSYYEALSQVPDPNVVDSLPRDFGSLSPFLQELLYHAIDTGFSGPLLYDWLASRGSLFQGLADVRVSMGDFFEFCHTRTEHQHCGLLHLLERLVLLDPRLTEFGLKLPFVGFDGELGSLSINADSLAERGLVNDYWSRFPESLIFRLGSVAITPAI